MAGASFPMQITPVDQDGNLFAVSEMIPQSLVDQILQTPWLDLQFSLEEGNRNLRRRIDDNELPWIREWHDCVSDLWHTLQQSTGCKHLKYIDTGFWVDMPTYTCPLHTDGELPGSMQMYWVGSTSDIGTTWYHYKDPDKIRHRFEFIVNTGYLMINQPEANGYRKLQWHGMLTPVPENSFRVTSYSWLTDK